ncbi:MAG TPA: hypothetical protein VJ011_07930 [Steroidobacteraceae bacterium]|nr:hypothetical protein [Steroidobacteraceae bacterium]
MARICASILAVAAALASTCARAELLPEGARSPVLTLYAAQISAERTWQKLLTEPGGRFVDAWLAACALAVPHSRHWNGALQLEAEAQAVYNFGAQHHWELNAVPVVARWQRFPWSGRFTTSAALGLGLSWASEEPEVEAALEPRTHETLVYWLAELTAGPRDARWAASLRIHHRSTAFGLMGSDGGMNALGIGVRYAF